MTITEVEFLETERRLLDWLQSHASEKDGVVTECDSQIIEELQLQDQPKLFFMAKMRLVAAGAISLFVDSGGDAGIQLNMRERRSAHSKRYVQLIVPLELVHEILARTRTWREEAFAQKGKETASLPPQIPVPIPPPVPKPPPPPPPRPNPLPTVKSPEPPRASKTPKPGYTLDERLDRGRVRLGVRPVAPGPIRPPVLSVNAATQRKG